MLEQFLIYYNQSILDALQKIDMNKKGFLVVCNHQKNILGLLTDGDIRRALIQDYTKHSSIQDIYNKDFKYITFETSLDTIANYFKSEQINFLPIVNEHQEVVNILTKKQYHIILLENDNLNFNTNLFDIDESKLEHEIYNRPWGFYKSTLLTPHAQSKIITIFPHEQLSLQKHKKREEHWIFIKGEGKIILEDSEQLVYPGKYVYIPKGCKHRITNTSDENLILTEVQLGSYFGEDDIIRYEDKYNRVTND